MRDGSTIETLIRKPMIYLCTGLSNQWLAGNLQTLPPRDSNIGDIVFEVRDWSVYHPNFSDIEILHKVNINVRKVKFLVLQVSWGQAGPNLP